ncbi:hypothetical protein Acav_3109 [Paracidovorax avenae ATCC 19860]|uniref:Transmembrane protein n=1 Tax=Paracidovorax avenae (strain ATCC 19860 / DSM 7227 / CCUG 15838 / JCM 20985 / LMG 2117 / NCPPB 1011) TaxID=643561 RepID=F0Q7D8_PARA1|nr:hypothetical protein [Paracidovorax avenae]ADX47011.1 hypothetical protein Acav_3109 [Paracidovorax avenae ATCC 19860]
MELKNDTGKTKAIKVLANIPLLLLVTAVTFYTLASFASSFQELPEKWLKAYPYMPPFAVYSLLSIHTLLTPGLALLVYAVILLRLGDRRSRFFRGISLLIYFPFRLGLIFILLGFFPLWLVFELVELTLLGYASRRLIKRLKKKTG